MTTDRNPALPLAAILALTAAAGIAPAEEETARRGPVVQVVQRAGPAIVGIATEEEVENPFHRSFLRSFLGTLLREEPPQPGAGNILGSGVLVDPQGYVLTNEHVVLRASRITVRLSDGRRLPADVVGTDPSSDLAVLRIDPGPGVAVAAMGRSSDLLVGEAVIALGNTDGTSLNVTTGVVSALKRSVRAGDRTYNDFVQTDASIHRGNSGGALLNIRGEMIGISTAILSEVPSVGYAIPVDRARKVLEDLIRFGEVRPAWLGLALRSTGEGASSQGGALTPGAAVRRVYPASPAEKGGLVAGDVVVRLAGTPVGSREDFDAVVRRLKVGEAMEVVIDRGGAPRSLLLVAATFPPSMSDLFLDDVLGVEVTDISRSLRLQFPQLPPDGVIVSSVRARSRAAATGLEEGDVIRRINNFPVHDMADLREAVPRVVGRSSLLLKVARGRFNHYVTIDLS